MKKKYDGPATRNGKPAYIDAPPRRRASVPMKQFLLGLRNPSPLQASITERLAG